MVKERLEEPTKEFFFENLQQPGQDVKFFAGNAPCRGMKQTNVLKQYDLKHGTTVRLTEQMAEHMRSKGTMRPMTNTNERGEIIRTGEYKEKHYALHEV